MHGISRILIAIACCSSPLFAQTVGLDELIRRVIEHDLDVAGLKARAEVAAADVGAVNPIRNPEIRLGYSHTSRGALERSYTESVTETVRETGTRNSSFNSSGSESGSFSGSEMLNDSFSGSTRTTVGGVNTDGQAVGGFDAETRNGSATLSEQSQGRFSGSFSGSESQTESFTRNQQITTTREITPTRNGRIIRERVTESTNEDFSENRSTSGQSNRDSQFSENRNSTSTENGTRNRSRDGESEQQSSTANDSESRTRNGSSSESESISGSESRNGSNNENVVSDRTIEEERFGEDPNPSSDQYSAQLRLYPRHPWEMRARTQEALAQTSLAEFLVQVQAREIADEVRADYRSLQLNLLDIDQLQRTVAVAEARYEAIVAAYEVRRTTIDKVGKARVAILDAEVELAAERQTFESGRDELALRAGLADPSRVDFTDDFEARWLDFKGMDLTALSDVAYSRNPKLGELAKQSDLVRSRLDINRAARIPWFSLVSASYDIEERHDRKYRDEWGVTVGFEIPIFAWLDSSSKSDRVALDAFQRQGELLRKRVRLQLTQSMKHLRKATDELSAFQEKGGPIRSNLEEELANVPDANPEAEKIREALSDSLLEIDSLELNLYKAYARQVLAFETLLGTDLSDVFTDDPDTALLPDVPELDEVTSRPILVGTPVEATPLADASSIYDSMPEAIAEPMPEPLLAQPVPVLPPPAGPEMRPVFARPASARPAPSKPVAVRLSASKLSPVLATPIATTEDTVVEAEAEPMPEAPVEVAPYRESAIVIEPQRNLAAPAPDRPLPARAVPADAPARQEAILIRREPVRPAATRPVALPSGGDNESFNRPVRWR